LLLVERREPLPLAPGLLERHATTDDLRNREACTQIVEERSRKAHGDSGPCCPIITNSEARSWTPGAPRLVPAIHRADLENYPPPSSFFTAALALPVSSLPA